MVDCESEVYTKLAQAVRAAFPGTDTTSEYVNAPASFPHVSIVQSDSYAAAGMLTYSSDDYLTDVTFEINIYSNKQGGKKNEAKSIAAVIDKIMLNMNFTRTAFTPVTNAADPTVYRVTARYRGRTDGKNFYVR